MRLRSCHSTLKSYFNVLYPNLIKKEEYSTNFFSLKTQYIIRISEAGLKNIDSYKKKACTWSRQGCLTNCQLYTEATVIVKLRCLCSVILILLLKIHKIYQECCS